MNEARHVRIFKNGRSRAIRIPKDMDIFGDQLVIRKDGDSLVLEPEPKKNGLAALLEEWRGRPPLSEADMFPEIDDPPPAPMTDFDEW